MEELLCPLATVSSPGRKWDGRSAMSLGHCFFTGKKMGRKICYVSGPPFLHQEESGMEDLLCVWATVSSLGRKWDGRSAMSLGHRFFTGKKVGRKICYVSGLPFLHREESGTEDLLRLWATVSSPGRKWDGRSATSLGHRFFTGKKVGRKICYVSGLPFLHREESGTEDLLRLWATVSSPGRKWDGRSAMSLGYRFFTGKKVGRKICYVSGPPFLHQEESGTEDLLRLWATVSSPGRKWDGRSAMSLGHRFFTGKKVGWKICYVSGLPFLHREESGTEDLLRLWATVSSPGRKWDGRSATSLGHRFFTGKKVGWKICYVSGPPFLHREESGMEDLLRLWATVSSPGRKWDGRSATSLGHRFFTRKKVGRKICYVSGPPFLHREESGTEDLLCLWATVSSPGRKWDGRSATSLGHRFFTRKKVGRKICYVSGPPFLHREESGMEDLLCLWATVSGLPCDLMAFSIDGYSILEHPQMVLLKPRPWLSGFSEKNLD
nr:PREDICTED: uncharacterized protein LOC103281082 isoform X2 [Anolis carolinensis]|eukprot:XP_016853343.1 PREDICTED: uncharacterized protein LOC103281082 isoform X2 [Anolis carolinensis]